MATNDLTTWVEPDDEVLDMLTRHGCLAADSAIIGAHGKVSAVSAPDGSRQGLTPAEETSVGLRAALRMLLANGLVVAVPRDDWPYWVSLGPPVVQEGDA